MAHDATARLLIGDQAKQEELFVHIGTGPEANGLRIAEAVEWPESLLFRFLDTVGDGSGTKDATGNYSSVAQTFVVRPPAAKIYALHTLIIHIEDTGAFVANGYGAAAAVTNGIRVYVGNGNDVSVLDLDGGVAIKSNTEWERVAYDARLTDYQGVSDHLTLAWDFKRSGSAIMLRPGHPLVVQLNDDFTFLTGHTFFVNGHQHDYA